MIGMAMRTWRGLLTLGFLCFAIPHATAAPPAGSTGFAIALEPVVRLPADGKAKPILSEAEQAKLLKRYQGLIEARQVLNDGIGPRGRGHAGRADIEITRLRSPILPELEMFHGLSVDRSQVAVDGPELVLDGGIFTAAKGKEHFLMPHFTGQNPDSSTAVHDDFMICPFGTKLIEMENCPRLGARLRATLDQSKNPQQTLREILALGFVLDMHLESIDGFNAPHTISRLEQLQPQGRLRISADVAARLGNLPSKAPYALPLPIAEKHGDSYRATGYVAVGSTAWYVELKVTKDSLYFARSLIASVPTFGP